jgi:phytoene desaturase
MEASSQKAIVIGGGVAGLAAAIRLSAKGHPVTLYEAANAPGGKLRERKENGYRFDLGPSLFTWPKLIQDLDVFARENCPEASLPSPFQYKTLDRSTHYFWEDGKSLVAWSDQNAFVAAAQKAFGSNAEALEAHIEHSRKSFEATRQIFLEQSLHEWRETDKSAWRAVLSFVHRLPLFGSLHRWNQKRLREPHLVQLFDRYATYNGSDPHRAPAMMHVIPHLEHGMGTHFPLGGMHGITQHLVSLAEGLGVDIKCGVPVERIAHEDGKVKGVVLESNRDDIVPAEIVISNSDVYPTYRKMLADIPAPEKILRQERSTSGVIFYWGIKTEHPELHLHNILFSKDYRAEFESISTTSTPGADPTVYINISSKVQSSDAPTGCENWFVMVNVGANPDEVESLVPEIRKTVLEKIKRTLGTDIEPLIATEFTLTPQGLQDQTSSWRGALYGASSNSTMAAFLRHRNRSTALRGLYFCGGSVHPGGGIPLCLLSARIATELIESHS